PLRGGQPHAARVRPDRERRRAHARLLGPGALHARLSPLDRSHAGWVLPPPRWRPRRVLGPRPTSGPSGGRIHRPIRFTRARATPPRQPPPSSPPSSPSPPESEPSSRGATSMLVRSRLDATTSGERSPPAPGARTAVETGWRVLAAGANRGMATASTRVPPARMYFVMVRCLPSTLEGCRLAFG